MKKVDFRKSFQKQYNKLPNKIQSQFDSRLIEFIHDANAPHLRYHSLK